MNCKVGVGKLPANKAKIKLQRVSQQAGEKNISRFQKSHCASYPESHNDELFMNLIKI